MRNRISALACLLASAALMWPPTAAGKQGAMLEPQLAALVPGRPTRAQLLILPVYRNSPFGPRQVTPAPAAGSVPVLTLSLPRGHAILRFAGTPLDRRGHSVVWITLPSSVAGHGWKVWVRAGRHVYPDLIDSQASQESGAPMTASGQPTGSRPPRHAGRGDAGIVPAWPLVLGTVALVGFALSRVRRDGRTPIRRARH